MLKITEANNIVTVSLDRPDVRNAFNPEMIWALTEKFKMWSIRVDIRAIVLRGEGKVFCAGGDLAWMKDMKKYSFEENKKDSEQLFEMFEAIYKCNHPIICVVHGAAYGGALGMIAASDYVICEEKAQLCFSEVKIGLAPAVISAFVLRKVSPGHVTPWMLSGKVFTASEAQRAGLVHDVVPESEIEKQLQATCQLFLEAGPEAIRKGKKLIQLIPSLTLDQAKMETSKLIAERRVSPEGQEGLTSFLDKRKPYWKP